jgi:Uncharacterized iron-regulated membrane protein
LYRRLWRWHFWAALIVVPFVLWQSVTGTLYLWGYDWVRWNHPALTTVVPQGSMQPISTQVAAALRTAPTAHVQAIQRSADARSSTVVLLRAADGLPEPVFVDPYRASVLGSLPASGWMPGWSRALHGGWPLGAPGSWLLELGDGWAMVMVLTGLYLWWPRGRRNWLAGLVPRLRSGPRVLWRDLHACVGAWFAILVLGLLISALPWTQFWGGKILSPIERATHQNSPAGFSPGGASAAQVSAALPALDRALASLAQVTDVRGFQARLAGRHLSARHAAMGMQSDPGSPWWIQTQPPAPLSSHTALADASSGVIERDITRAQFPLIAGLVALGVNLHQGDFGVINRVLNTSMALALIWIVISGLVGWWRRRPKGRVGAPARASAGWPVGLGVGALVMMVLMPLFGASVLVVAGFDFLLHRYRERATDLAVS